MNRNLNRRIHPIAEADGLSPKNPRKVKIVVYATLLKRGNSLTLMERLVHTLRAVKAL